MGGERRHHCSYGQCRGDWRGGDSGHIEQCALPVPGLQGAVVQRRVPAAGAPCVTASAFLLNGEPVEVAGLPPTTTLLNWLRRERRLTGSKEGCAEGDCGACTVVVRSAPGEPARAVNACILLLPMLDGAAITTVEGLSDGRGGLHPASRRWSTAMARNAGSARRALSCRSMPPTRTGGIGRTRIRPPIDDTLAGNLCRCTGYGPIVAAAQTDVRTAGAAGTRAATSALLASARQSRDRAPRGAVLRADQPCRTDRPPAAVSRCAFSRRRHRYRSVGNEAASPPAGADLDGAGAGVAFRLCRQDGEGSLRDRRRSHLCGSHHALRRSLSRRSAN